MFSSNYLFNLSRHQLIEYKEELLELVKTTKVFTGDSEIEKLAKLQLKQTKKILRNLKSLKTSHSL